MAGSCGGFCDFEPADFEINAFGKFVIFCGGGACFPGSFGAWGILPPPNYENKFSVLFQNGFVGLFI